MKGRGGVRVPARWRILYKDGDAWKPVENSLEWGVEKDRFNTVGFKPVTTSGLTKWISSRAFRRACSGGGSGNAGSSPEGRLAAGVALNN